MSLSKVYMTLLLGKRKRTLYSSSPKSEGKSVFPILETLYHDFTELRCRYYWRKHITEYWITSGVCSGLSFWRSYLNECYLLSCRKELLL